MASTGPEGEKKKERKKKQTWYAGMLGGLSEEKKKHANSQMSGTKASHNARSKTKFLNFGT